MIEQSTIRVFAGSPVDDELYVPLERLYQKKSSLEGLWQHKVTWVAPENWHMTWLFLGNISTQSVAEVISKLSTVLAEHRALQLEMNKLAFWPNANRAKQLVWEGNSQNTPVQAIARGIHEAFPDNSGRHFNPHITIARIKPDKTGKHPRFEISTEDMPGARGWDIHQICLYKSTLTPNGARYETLHAWELDTPIEMA